MRAVARQIELHRDALPARVGVRRDQVAGNVAGQDRDRIHAGLGIAGPKRRSSAGASRRTKASLHRARAQGAADDVPHRALLRRQVADVFRKKIDLDPRMGAIGEVMAFAAAVHRPVVRRLRHVGEHQRVDIVGKDAVEYEMGERRVGRGRGIDRAATKSRKPFDRERRLPGLNSSVWSIGPLALPCSNVTGYSSVRAEQTSRQRSEPIASALNAARPA